MRDRLNLAAQDEARDRISEFYTTEGSRWRVIDRREDPRFGYRALHLVVFVDDLPVEIQIRTELQDTWAQIVERLADRWGRGIRYGEDPEHPDSIVRSGKVVVTRRQHLATLTALSDAIWLVEQSRRRSDELKSLLVNADSIWQVVQSAWSESPADKILPRAIPLVEEFAADLAPVSGELDDEVRELMATPPADLTTAQARRVVDAGLDDLRRRDIELTALLASEEQGLRATLQLVAGATDEGV